MIDLPMIERDIGRILNSHRSMAQRTGCRRQSFSGSLAYLRAFQTNGREQSSARLSSVPSLSHLRTGQAERLL
jgi:hypothetical protein